MYYVTMTDKFLSGWALSDKRINKLIFVCETYEQAETVYNNAANRSEMKNINITSSKPYYSPKKYYAQIKTIADYPSWYEKK